MGEQQDKNHKISVSIAGISYQLISRENESYAREIARKADDTIRQVLAQHPTLSTTQAIVLAMINTFDALTKLSKSLDEAQAEVELIETRSAQAVEKAKSEMNKAQHELFMLRDTDFELKKEILRVTELNKQLELEIASLHQKQNGEPFASSKAFELETQSEPASVQETTDFDVRSDDSGDTAESLLAALEQEDSAPEEMEADSLLDYPDSAEDTEYFFTPDSNGEESDRSYDLDETPDYPEAPDDSDSAESMPKDPYEGYKQASLEDYFR